jgi:MSHA biogenesis protein MshQ
VYEPMQFVKTVVSNWVWLFTACLTLALSPAQAQTYAYRADTFAYDTPSGGATSVTWHTSSPSPACTNYPDGDDDWADIPFPVGFGFRFGGVDYSSVRVYSNGILAFPTDVSGFHRDYTSQALPITAGAGNFTGCPNAVPQNLMLPYWLDIVAGTANGTAGASIQYEMLGTSPNRRFVISWVNVKLYGNTTRYNFQVQLLESATGVNGNFKYQYTTGSSTGTGASVGVQLSTTDYTQYAYNQNFIDTSLGTSILWYPANQLAAKSAEYRFDEGSWSGATGEVKDTSGNSQDATLVTNNVANVAGGKLCRGATFTNNTSNTVRDAIATPIVPAAQGSVSFWYKSNNAWNSADAMLLDATTAAARPFFLLKRSTGALRFSVTDSAGTVITANTSTAYTFGAGTWHHIAISWSLKAGTNQTVLQIIVDGALAATTGTTPYRTTSSGSIAALSTLYVGDNRTSGVTPSGGSPNGANGTIDEVYVYAMDINATQAAADMNLTRPSCTTLNHFHIVHDGATSSCTAAARITIEAHDAAHALFSLSGTTMTLTTTPARGTWSNVVGGAVNSLTAIGAGTGTATYTFANESAVTFGLSDTQSGSLNINVASGSISENTGTASSCVAADYTTGTTCDASRNFVCAAFGFNCVESGADALSGRLFTKLAGAAFSFDVVALKDANSDGIADGIETLYASDQNKSVTVELVDGAGSAACSVRTAITPAISQTLTFTKANQPTELGRKTTATMTVAKAYPDLRCRVTDANQTPSIVSCSSDDFSVRPSAVTLVTAASAGAPSSTATPTIRAGANFSLQATTSAGSNYAGSLTRDTTKHSAQTTAQDTSQAGGGVAGTLAPAALVANAAAVNASYSEVGYLYLAPGAYRDDSYTSVDSGAGDCVTATAGDANLADTLVGGKYGCSIGNKNTVSLGRFIPDHFDTVVTQACVAGTFTYSAQPFVVTTTARNVAGGATQNYAGSLFAKATTLSNAGATTNLTGNTIAANSFAAGVGAATSVRYTFPSPTTAPLAAAMRAIDTESVSSSGFTEGTANIRSGRVQLQNAYGSEFLPLPVPMTIQFWNGSWQPNTADTCTVILPSRFAWDFLPAGVAPRSNNLSACRSAATSITGTAPNYTVNLAAPGASFTGWANLTLNLAASAAGSTCTAVNAGSGYSAAATTANAPWLQFNWTGVVGNPTARATFGSFKSPLIYRRENY